MPNVRSMERYYEEGICKANSFLMKECGARRIPDSEARSFEGRQFVAGWQLIVEIKTARRRINVYVDQEFPFSFPYFVLVDRPAFPTWPHVEEDGLLCLVDGEAVADFRQPDKVIGELLRDAYRLILDCESGTNQNDFRTEFYSYWRRGLHTDGEKVRSLLAPRAPSRLVQIWRGETRSVVGESEEQVLRWLRNLYGDKPQFDSTEPACLLWLPQALMPSEYPKTAADLYRLAQIIPRGKELLEHFAGGAASPFYFILGTESGNGPCLAAVRTYKPASFDFRGKRIDRSSNGFRPGKIPRELRTQRLFSSDAAATRMAVERVDGEWIHGRGRDPRHKELSSKTAIFFGCGSIGAPIAHQLVMAGVSHILMVDPSGLSWANVGRHPLGAEYVGYSKAIKLAEIWRKAYPHAQFEAFEMSSQSFLMEHSDLTDRADMIICATADWKSEQKLNFCQLAGEIAAPVIYTWTEPNACAGHAVLVFAEGPCLQCGFSAMGNCKFQVTEWDENKKQQREPACGAVFEPYGPVELLGTVSAAASLALDGLLNKINIATDRIWAGPESLLIEAGGSWSKSWINENAERSKGGFQEDRVWGKDSLCSACHDRVIERP